MQEVRFYVFLISTFLGSVLMGFGINWQVGLGTFLTILAIGALTSLLINEIDQKLDLLKKQNTEKVDEPSPS